LCSHEDFYAFGDFIYSSLLLDPHYTTLLSLLGLESFDILKFLLSKNSGNIFESDGEITFVGLFIAYCIFLSLDSYFSIKKFLILATVDDKIAK
jgi:hypothetical protein